jgi:hypothetical protein
VISADQLVEAAVRPPEVSYVSHTLQRRNQRLDSLVKLAEPA